MKRSLSRVLRSRFGAIFVAVVTLLATTTNTAQACFFGCVWEFGLISVSDGTVYYYNGCDGFVVDGHRYVFCYYTDALN
jgi:hypothetical protein